jgi:hypothetical protein
VLRFLLARRYPVSGITIIRFATIEMMLMATEREEATQTFVVESVGCGLAWPRLLIRMVWNSTPFEASSNKLPLFGQGSKDSPSSKVCPRNYQN